MGDRVKMKRKIIIGCILLIIIVGAAVFFVGNFLNKQQISQKSEEENVVVNVPEGDTVDSTDSTAVDSTASEQETEEADWYNLPGYQNGVTAEEKQKICGIKLPYKVADTPIEIEGIGQYTGPFVEDGSDEPVANVLSVIVKNTSDKVVEFAELRFKVNNSEEAVFHISTLPAGSSALVMENNRREYNSEDKMKFGDKLYAQKDERSLMNDQVKVTAQDQKLSVQNLTEDNLGTVYVRYKGKLNDNYYLGGITYSCKIENVGPNQTKEAETMHFTVDGSQVLMVEAIDE